MLSLDPLCPAFLLAHLLYNPLSLFSKFMATFYILVVIAYIYAIHIHKCNLLSPYNVMLMCVFSGLTMSYSVSNQCALLPLRGLSPTLSIP